MKHLIENYKKPTPKKWRKIGDFALILIIVLEAQLNAMPIVNEWAKWGIATALIAFKFWTNTRTDKNIYEGEL